MIAAIIIISLAFAWLLVETDWMRVRLPIGAYPDLIVYQRKSWDDLKPTSNLNK